MRKQTCYLECPIVSCHILHTTLIDDVNSSQLGEAQLVAHLADPVMLRCENREELLDARRNTVTHRDSRYNILRNSYNSMIKIHGINGELFNVQGFFHFLHRA